MVNKTTSDLLLEIRDAEERLMNTHRSKVIKNDFNEMMSLTDKYLLQTHPSFIPKNENYQAKLNQLPIQALK